MDRYTTVLSGAIRRRKKLLKDELDMLNLKWFAEDKVHQAYVDILHEIEYEARMGALAGKTMCKVNIPTVLNNDFAIQMLKKYAKSEGLTVDFGYGYNNSTKAVFKWGE